MITRRLFTLAALLIALPGGLFAQAEPQADVVRKPAILIDNWHHELDLTYVKQLQATGIEVEAITHNQLTWDLLKTYNVLVLIDFPQEGKVTNGPSGGPGSGPNLEETLVLVDRFLAEGGGVMINLLQHANNAPFYNAAQKALARWGARRPLEQIVLPADQIVKHSRLLDMPFFRTANVAASPVSDGVSNVWYPVGGGHWVAAGPIDVEDSWTTVLRAPQGSRTVPLPLPDQKPGVPYYDAPFVRPNGVEEPPLFAIRDLEPGRLALFHAHPNFHFGSGLSWVHNGAMLDKGLNSKPSDFGKLLRNTLGWLAAPSLASGSLGGAITPADRWARPLERPENPNYQRYLGAAATVNLDPALVPPPANLLKGIVGPRTAYSGGQGTVGDYAAMAREKGLSFILFLEEMGELTAAELEQLVADCKEHSGDDLLLIAGYRIRSNLGNQFFNFGKDPLLIHDDYLSEDRKTFIIQPVNEEGYWETSKAIDFVFQSVRGQANSLGWFDFTGPMKSGGMAVHDLRLFSMVGLVYYNRGEFVEDVTDQFLRTNAGTLSAVPVVINLVDSPAEMAAAVDGDQALTYVAGEVRQLWSNHLCWKGPYGSSSAFPSSGPMIHSWPFTYRTGSYAGELFASRRMLIPAPLRITSDVGLKEILVYEGEQLFRRFLPSGEKEFTTRLFLSGSIYRSMSVVATDVNGGKAVSYPLRGWRDGSPGPVFCSDHVNDCGNMLLFRGPGWSNYMLVPQIPEPGVIWDGMGSTVGKLPLLAWGNLRPTFQTSAGHQETVYQTPVKELGDDTVWRGRSVTRGVLLPGSPHRNPWSGFGPIAPIELVDMEGIFTLWAQYQDGTAVGWGPMGRSLGPTATLYTQINTFKQDLDLNLAMLGYEWRRALPVNVMLVHGRSDTLINARDVSPRVAPGAVNWRIDTGDWVAAISPNESNSLLWVNRGVPLILSVSPERTGLTEELPAGGLAVKAGESRTIEWFQTAWPMDRPIAGTEELRRWIRYFEQPDGLELLRGARIAAPPGVVELSADNGAVEIKVPRSRDNLDANLPFRVSGFNPRWSAILWQKDGYVGAGRYGKPQNRFRSLATDFDGRIYFPIHTGQAALHHLVAGQPVIADEAGSELFIEVVCLSDAEGQAPPLWHVSVNNPTDKPVTTSLTRTMALPGLDWSGETIELKPGEGRLLVHPVAPVE